MYKKRLITNLINKRSYIYICNMNCKSICCENNLKIEWRLAHSTLGHMLKEPTHIQAHLVFADTQSPIKKPKELEFLPTLGRHRKEKE